MSKKQTIEQVCESFVIPRVFMNYLTGNTDVLVRDEDYAIEDDIILMASGRYNVDFKAINNAAKEVAILAVYIDNELYKLLINVDSDKKLEKRIHITCMYLFNGAYERLLMIDRDFRHRFTAALKARQLKGADDE
jgi:hypothetical protein